MDVATVWELRANHACARGLTGIGTEVATVSELIAFMVFRRHHSFLGPTTRGEHKMTKVAPVAQQQRSEREREGAVAVGEHETD